ncbi:MAG TPA: cation diffusion facilitator family transporter [Solirubrobacteraceae bacterium]|jgi:cobalt-zinc-cadmium efflux system protein|nr:cation diffusion facilitator family transporter [Solirubrobacteraceae bacterium]
MAHDHAGHSHGAPAHAHTHLVRADADRGRLTLALGLIVALMAVEIAAGVVAHSLALLSDAGHMLTDAAAIGFSLLALTLAARPARGAMTFGFRRAEILSAQANGVTLLILAAFIAYEAIHRLFDPLLMRGWLVLIVALAGVLVNLLATWTLARANRESLNIEGSFQHLLTDLYGFIGTAIAAGVILLSGFQRADPIVSLLIAALMVRSGAALVRASGRIFLEAAPEGLDPRAIGAALVGVPGVVEVHDLHVWEISSGFPALSAHVLVDAQSDCHAARRAMEAMLRERFGLDHTTLQVDHAGAESEILQLAIAPARASAQAPAQQPDRRDDR